METRNRKLAIGIVVAVVLIAACGCMVSTLASAASWVVTGRRVIALADTGTERYERIARSFDVGDEPVLEVSAAVGVISVRASEGRTIRVVAHVRGTRLASLRRADVSMTQQGDRVVVRAQGLRGNADEGTPLEIDIVAPPGTRLAVRSTVGEVDIRGLQGSLDVDLDAGAIRVNGAEGTARLHVRAGEIRYEGAPTGDCHFEVGLGEIALQLPRDADLALDLAAELGTVDLDVPLEGHITSRRAEGTLGDGSQGEVYARAGAGSVRVGPR